MIRLVLPLLWLVSYVSSDCIEVGNNVTALRELIQNATDEELRLCSFAWESCDLDADPIVIQSDTTLLCEGTEPCAISCGRGHFRVVPGVSLTLQGTSEAYWRLTAAQDTSVILEPTSTFTGSYVFWSYNTGVQDAGALLANTSTVELSHCEWVGNRANGTFGPSLGGAMVAYGSDVTIEDSVFQDNLSPTGGGGAMALFGLPEVDGTRNVTYTVRNTEITGSSSRFGGGAIVVFKFATVLELENVSFDNNTAEEYGDVIYRDYLGTTINGLCNTTFEGDSDCVGSATKIDVCEAVDDTCGAGAAGVSLVPSAAPSGGGTSVPSMAPSTGAPTTEGQSAAPSLSPAPSGMMVVSEPPTLQPSQSTLTTPRPTHHHSSFTRAPTRSSSSSEPAGTSPSEPNFGWLFAILAIIVVVVVTRRFTTRSRLRQRYSDLDGQLELTESRASEFYGPIT